MRAAHILLPEVKAVLEHNGIDWTRCTDTQLSHNAKEGITVITVSMVALVPAEEE